MPFPEFDPSRRKLLFFSRGRGRGHARPDVEMVRELVSLRPDIEVRFVSYGPGAETIAEFGLPLIDLDMPESGPTAEISVAAGRLIRWLGPDLVVSHEEFAAAPAAKIFDKPCLFITDFFADPELYSMHALQFADEILFVGRPGVFEEPDWLKGKVRYIGPVVRQTEYGPTGRQRARLEIGIAPDAFVLGVFPGFWTEHSAEFAASVLAAFDELNAPKAIIWVAGPDHAQVEKLLAGRTGAHLFHQCWEMDRLMSASDVAITRANRVSTVELVSRGVPVIAVSYGLNPPDDRAIEGLPGVSLIEGLELDSRSLLRHIADPPTPGPATVEFASFADCASVISRNLPPHTKG